MFRGMISLLMVAASMFLLDWLSVYHLVVGVPLAIGTTIGVLSLMARLGQDPDEVVPSPENRVGSLLAGFLSGLVCVAVLAGTFRVLDRLSVPVIFTSSCAKARERLEVMQEASLFGGIPPEADRLLESRNLSPSCRNELTRIKVHSFLQLVQRSQGFSKWESLLAQALDGAQLLDDQDLTASLQASQRLLALVPEKEKLQLDYDRLEEKMKEDEQAVQILESSLAKSFIVPDILFESGKADLKKGSARKLSEIARQLMVGRWKSVLVLGHTDSIGEGAANLALSQSRAQAVSKALVVAGMEEDLIVPRGLGERAPIASNKTKEGQLRNRRVEVIALRAAIVESQTHSE